MCPGATGERIEVLERIGAASIGVARLTALALLIVAGRASVVSAQSSCTTADPWCDADADGDGVVDSVDRCADQPEDHDGHDDLDGCPDPDDDADGIPDGDDECPDYPEDRDGVRDDDGCPDVDAQSRARVTRPRSRRGPRRPKGTAPREWLTLAFGVANSRRSLDVRVFAESAPRRYRSPDVGYLEAGLEVSAFLPFAPAVGMQLGLWHSVLVGTTGCTGMASSLSECPSSMQRDVATSAHELAAALTLRHRFGRSRDSVSSMLSAGFGQFAFTLDEAAVATLNPAVAIETHRYTYLSLELRFELPIPTTPVVADVAAFHRVGLDDVGGPATARFGTGPGSGEHSGFGMRTGLRWDLPFLASGAFVAGRFDWYHFDTSFAGGGSAGGFGADAGDDMIRVALLVGTRLRP